MLYVIGYILIKPILMLLFRPKVINRKAMFQKGKVIYISNHMVLGDPIAVGILSNRCVHFMAKSTLSEKPFGRWLFRQLLSFPVQQYSADRKALKKAISLPLTLVFAILRSSILTEAFVTASAPSPVVTSSALRVYATGKEPESLSYLSWKVTVA